MQLQHLACQNVSKLRIFCGQEAVHTDSFLILCLLFASWVNLCPGFGVCLCFAFLDANMTWTKLVIRNSDFLPQGWGKKIIQTLV